MSPGTILGAVFALAGLGGSFAAQARIERTLKTLGEPEVDRATAAARQAIVGVLLGMGVMVLAPRGPTSLLATVGVLLLNAVVLMIRRIRIAPALQRPAMLACVASFAMFCGALLVLMG